MTSTLLVTMILTMMRTQQQTEETQDLNTIGPIRAVGTAGTQVNTKRSKAEHNTTGTENCQNKIRSKTQKKNKDMDKTPHWEQLACCFCEGIHLKTL